MKTFGSKRLQRKPKRGSGNYVRTHALEVSSGCGASIENVFENFKSPNCGAGDLACVAWCACARKCARAAPIEVPLRRFRSPARLTGPIEGTFDRVCTTLLNRRRSTKVLFPNINDMKTMTACQQQQPFFGLSSGHCTHSAISTHRQGPRRLQKLGIIPTIFLLKTKNLIKKTIVLIKKNGVSQPILIHDSLSYLFNNLATKELSETP